VDVISRARQLYIVDPSIQQLGRVKLGCPFNASNIKIKTTAAPTTTGVAPTTGSKLLYTNEERDLYEPASNQGLGQTSETKEIDGDMTIGKGVIIWITAAIVVGTIIIMISAACVVHHIRMKYSGKITTTVKNSDEDYGSTELSIAKSDRTAPQLVTLSDGIMTPFNLPPLVIGKNTEVNVKFISYDEEHTL